MKKLVGLLTAMAVLPAGLDAQFFTDGFNYPNGELTLNDGTGDNVSGGAWIGHGGTTFDDNLTVLNNELIINNSGSEDANRLTGVTMGAGQTWYYGVSFRVNDLRADPNTESINNDYFAHFKDSSLGFRGRAYLDDPNFPGPSKFTIGLAATSGAQTVAWPVDLSFGTTYVMVVSYDYDTGASSLWINPVNIASTSIAEAAIVNAGTAIESLAFRQDFVSPGAPNNQVIVGVASIGDDFDQVLAAVITLPPIKASIELVAGLSENGLPRIEKKICWSTIFNETYQVQYSSDLGLSNWFNLGNAVIGDGTTICVFDTTQDLGNRFYRVVNTP